MTGVGNELFEMRMARNLLPDHGWCAGCVALHQPFLTNRDNSSLGMGACEVGEHIHPATLCHGCLLRAAVPPEKFHATDPQGVRRHHELFQP